LAKVLGTAPLSGKTVTDHSGGMARNICRTRRNYLQIFAKRLNSTAFPQSHPISENLQTELCQVADS
jgi:hypothetical protein